MGALYLAADTGAFDRTCVVKELLDYYDPTDPEEARRAETRFETEARLLAELSHPGIPRIYSYFSEAGRHYIVMEYIEGETLERAVTHSDPLGNTVAAHPLAAEEVVRHAIRICRVLEYLADQPTPVIHHDIKPANIIVDETSGDVRLVDFGTAQSRTPWAVQARRERKATSLFGTQGFAAPEQFQGRSETRSDVYSLAATVYHLLTNDDPGDHPFQFPQMASLPDPLSDALARALRPEVHRRSTALEFRQALEAWLIPEDAAQPFVFRNGAVAHTTEELVALCEQHWTEACVHLEEGDFDRWFRSRNRHDLVAKAKSARLERDTNAALEAFVRRLNPRLKAPRIAVEPEALDFGRVTRDRKPIRRLRVRNEGRGYGQAMLSASVPWLTFEPLQVGCLAGHEQLATVRLDASALPLRREHLAVIACMPANGPRISVSVSAQLDLVRETLRRIGMAVSALAGMTARGLRQGIALWTRTFRSLLKSRYGPWVLVVEVLLLAAVMVAIWTTVDGASPGLLDLAAAFFKALPLALLAVYVLPALVLVVAGIVREMVGARRDGGR
jgi:serine/threonine protein kinase